MKKTLLISIALLLYAITNAQIVSIPDANFKAYLVSNGYINTNNDAEIQVSEAANYTDGIYVSNLNITDLTGIEAFTAIYQLICDHNQLTNLDVSNNVDLQVLDCSFNQLTHLDVTNNTGLLTLKCQNNQLTGLNANNYSIATLFAQNNLLTHLDVSNVNWNNLNVSNNQLLSLSAGSGNMANFEGFDATINNLTCINVTDVGYSAVTWVNIDDYVGFSLDCEACIIDVPDVNFKTYLVTNPLINVNGDGEIQCSEAYAFTGTIDAGFLNISNLKGIEEFVNLPILYCNNNDLTSVDLGSNLALLELRCSTNLLEDLDITQNTELTFLNCSSNPLNSINISQNTALEELWCRSNSISNLDLSQNTALTYLDFRNNQISNIDLTQNLNLEKLYCRDNMLTNLDLSSHTSLIVLNAVNNQLTSLDVKNGNNTNFTSFFTTDNPDLTCINVDDAAWSTANWTSIDATISFSENCDCIVNIPDAIFKDLLVSDAAINTNGDTEIQCSEAAAFTGTIAVGYWSIADLTGIEAFTSITALYCNNNDLTSLDVSHNTALTFLDASSNPINTLDISQNINLTTLYCSNNALSVLDITQNTLLTFLECDDNSLSTLNLTQNVALEDLRCENNALNTLNLTQNPALATLECRNNLLTSLDLSQNTALVSLVCNDNLLTELDVSSNILLNFIFCNNNELTSLNVANGNNINFEYFKATNNPNLTCIEVDDATWSTANWTNIDATASFSENCALATEAFAMDAISMYPNPAHNILYIETQSDLKDISIFNLIGKLVLRTTTSTIDISHIPTGMYLVKFKDVSGATGTQKFIKN